MTMENNKGDQLGDKGDKATGRHTIQQRETRRETREDKGGHTIQHRHTCGETMGDKGGQDLGKGDTPSNTKLDTLRKH